MQRFVVEEQMNLLWTCERARVLTDTYVISTWGLNLNTIFTAEVENKQQLETIIQVVVTINTKYV